MYLVNLRSGWKLWWSVLFSIMLIVGWAITPAQAGHCKGKHKNDPGCGGAPPADFNPEIVYTGAARSGKGKFSSITSLNLVVADATVSNTQVVFTLPAGTGGLRHPSWSPDGTEVLFTQEVDGQWGIYRLSIFNVEGDISVGEPALW